MMHGFMNFERIAGVPQWRWVSGRSKDQ